MSGDVDEALRVLAEAKAAIESAETALAAAHADARRSHDTIADVGGVRPGRTLGLAIEDLDKSLTTIRHSGPITAAVKREIDAAMDRLRGGAPGGAPGTVPAGAVGGDPTGGDPAAGSAEVTADEMAVDGSSRTVVELSSSDPTHVRQLNKPQPNATVIVDGRFRYETDEHGRVVKATTTLSIIDLEHPRSEHAQRTLEGKLEGDHAGHLFARIFKGPGQKVNLVPMEALGVNLGQFRQLERRWEDAIEAGDHVEVEIELAYVGDDRRPQALYVRYQSGTSRRRDVKITNTPRSEDE
ncbi:DNA/RNA non-specific endonuclease [Nocardioides speluncae]|uniref:DNA/RNA non-specific endonuclease n=1 Tax=Nocardioides speluncae TaxID=2670337 RepID=UPI000D69ECD5|nr:DNA/RNA non-specific endonuclease [Nocardioides speluncae]